MNSHPPSLQPLPPEGGETKPPPIARWRKILWSAFAVSAIGPPVWLVGLLGAAFLYEFSALPRTIVREAELLLWGPPVVVLVAIVPIVRVGLRRGWPGRNRQLKGLGAGASVSIGSLVFLVLSFQKVNESSQLKAMLPRQPAAAMDQFFLENPDRIFLKYDELIGPDRYIKAYHATDGDDLKKQFPMRRDWLEPVSVRLPDGTTVRRVEVLAAFTKRGLIMTYPLPQEDRYDPKRVYRLDCGVSFRGNRVVNLPPDPAGREGRDQNGIHTYSLTDGRRFEITYQGGVPDGPFRAYQADGAPWGEATYRNGRVVSAWLITRDGRKIDELKDGGAAQQAMAASRQAASRDKRISGLQKLRAKDYAGAIIDLTQAIVVNPGDAELHRARAEAYRATGDLDRAIADYGAAEGFTPGQLGEYKMSEELRNLVLARGHRRQQAGDAAGAARDFAAIGKDAGWAAEEWLRRRDPKRAIRILDPAIAVAPTAELLAARADARRTLPGQQSSAESDYTQAIELARQGKMQIPANQRIFPAQWRYKRGHVRRWMRNFDGAAEDFRAALPSLPTGGIINRSDAALWLFLAQCEAGRRDAAVRELQATDRANWWPAGREIARFLLGEITEAELDAAVKKSNQEGDRLKASLLSGLLRRLAGDEAGAMERIGRASRGFNHDTIEIDAANFALKTR
jgi:tetratricopeptide (TPR) repeat protein